MIPLQNRTVSTLACPEATANRTCAREVSFNLYKTALNSTDQKSSEVFSELSDQVVAHFDVLNQKEDKSSPDMPDALQEALVNMCMVEKDNSCLSQYDIINVLNELEKKLNVQQKNELKKYEQNGLESLLKNGVELYNKKTGKHILLNTKEFVTSVEIHFKINSYLALNDNINQAKASQFHQGNFEGFCESSLKAKDEKVIQLLEKKMTAQQIFQHHPECRKDRHVPCDKKGLDYLRELKINGPLTIQKIANGLLTIKEAIEIKEIILQEIQKKLNDPGTTIEQRNNLNSTGVRKYIIDGSFSTDEGANLSVDGRNVFLGGSQLEKRIDDGSISMKRVFDFIRDLDNGALKGYELSNFFYDLEQSTLTKEQRIDLIRCIDNYSVTLEQAINLMSDDHRAG